MRATILSMIAITAVGACGGTNSGDTGLSLTAATNTHCASSSDGPAVTSTDANTDPGCQPGGRCLLVAAHSGGPPCGAVSTDGSGRILDAGCVESDPDAGPSWSCVYGSGNASGSGSPDLP